MGVKHVEVFGDSLLVVQQVSKVCQCYNGTLNAYFDKCLDIVSSFDEFTIRHLPREENGQTNALAQQASGYNVRKGKFNIRKPMQMIAELQFLDEPIKPVDGTGLTAPTGLTGPETGLTDQTAENTNSVMKKNQRSGLESSYDLLSQRSWSWCREKYSACSIQVYFN